MIAQLPPDLAEFVSHEVAEGHYESEVQLMCEAIRLLRLRRAIQAGLAHSENDIVLEDDAALAEFFDALDAEVDQDLRSKAS